jgi:hypothetical protein
MGALVQVYIGIDYSSPLATKTHAHIAAGYLSGAVKNVVPHNMADVLLEGLRLMGQAAQLVVAHDTPDQVATLSEQIALVACTGGAREEYRPVTLEGMAQLTNLTIALLAVKNRDIHFAADEVRQHVALVAKIFLKIPDTPLSSVHSTYLAPYFSSVSAQGLRARLTVLANALGNAEADNADAKVVIGNIERWADDIYLTAKELLLAAVEAKSHFTFDMIYWIQGVTEILLALSHAPACHDHDRDELRKHGRWLIFTLSWIPDDKDAVTFVENFQLTEKIFDAVLDAYNRGSEEIAIEIAGMLLSWTFKGGRHQPGWAILDRGLSALAAFAVVIGDAQIDKLKTDISADLAKATAPSQEIRDRAAEDLRERAATPPGRDRFTTSSIEAAIERVDHAKLRPLLMEIADLLSPPAT